MNSIDNLQHDNSPHPPFTTGSSAVEEQTDETLGEPASHSDVNPEVTITVTITDLCTDYVARSIINVAFSIQEVISNVNAQSFNRAFDSSSLLYLLKFSNLFHLDDTTESNDPNISTHTEDLKRHLAGFGLEIESVSKDGDCAFRSIIRQLVKMDFDKTKGLEDHPWSLNLMAGSEDEDTFTVRQLFVEEFIRGEDEYSGFVAESTTTLTERANEFRMKGVFDREIGDLVMKVCCNVLKVSIIIITSSRSTPVVPFVPDSPLSTTPIYIAFHYYGAGHYDATNQICTSGM